LVIAAICLSLGVCDVWAAGPRGTPEKPELHYWFLNTAGPESEPGVMDARVIALAEALGDNRIEECRELARALAGEAEDPEVRRQAVEYLVETYLAEGDFAGAREAAKGLSHMSPEVCDAMLARVNQREVTYHAEVGGLQRIVATTRDPEEASRAQLQTAHLHHQVGRLHLALTSYLKVIDRYPGQRSATAAVAQMAGIYTRRDSREQVPVLCGEIMRHHPNELALAVSAGQLAASHGTAEGGEDEAQAAMYQVIESCPGTVAAAVAQMTIGDIFMQRASPRDAITAWEICARDYRRHQRVSQVAGMRLADAHYQAGFLAWQNEEYADAIDHLSRLLRYPGWDGDWEKAGIALTSSYVELGDLVHAEQAAAASLALGGDLAEVAYQLGAVQCARGDHATALATFESVVRGHPGTLAAESSALAIDACRSHLRAERGRQP